MSVAPQISVVITNYNYRAFLAEAIASVLSQQLLPKQIIVVDDGSTDDSVDFLRERYGNGEVQLIATTNQGQLSAFMTGVAAATGEVIAFLDADDRWASDYLSRIADVYQSKPEVNFVFTNMQFFGQREGLGLPETASRDFGLSILLGAFYTQFQGNATSAVSMRRTLACQVLELPKAMVSSWRTRADDCLVVGSDILGGHKFYLAEPLVHYRAHGNNAWLNNNLYGAKSLLHWLRAQSMIEHYRSVAGLSTTTLRFAKHEFRSKPQPRWRDLWQYSVLVGLSDLTFWQRFSHRLALLRHWLRQCRVHS